MSEEQLRSADEIIRHLEASVDDFAEAIRDPAMARYIVAHWQRLYAAADKYSQSISTAMIHYDEDTEAA